MELKPKKPDWKHLTITEIAEYIRENSTVLMLYKMSGYDYILDHESYSDTFLDECIINNKSNQRLINLIIETYKSQDILIRKRDFGGLIKFFIYY